MKKLQFIFNPNTGGGRLKHRLMDILCRFSQEGYELSVWPTSAQGDARYFAEKYAAGHDMVVCCGGDGTLNEVVNGLITLKNPPLLGYIPGGTTNDFASSLRLPRTNMGSAVSRIINPKKIIQYDVGMFNQTAFTYVAAFGAFTDVPYTTSQETKNSFGYFAYISEALQALPTLQSYAASFVCDDEVLEGEFLLGMVSNSFSIGGFSLKRLHKKIDLSDGMLEVTLLRRPQNLSDLRTLSTGLLSGSYNSDILIVRQVKSFSFEGGLPISWTLDGEFGGNLTSANITAKTQALNICV